MKIRVGLLVGYNGIGYHGLQLNNDLHTIEKTISECLFEVGAISEVNAEDPRKIHFKSSSRTDKGVHAALNLVSVKIQVNISPELISRLKELLSPKNIHLYDIMRLTKSIIPSKNVESRTYEYIIPTFFLRESNFNKEVEGMDDENERNDIKRVYSDDMIDEIIGYKSSEEDQNVFNDIVQRYVGTRDFHNFTNLNNDKGSSRYIKSIVVSPSYVNDDVEYIRISISGQSFLLHQIRKMVLFAILLSRYSRANVEMKFNMVFSRENIHVPKGPAEYLLLDKPIFYRLRRNGSDSEEIKVDDEERMEYKRSVLYPHIHRRENLTTFLYVLDSVRFHRDNMKFLD